MQNNKKIQPIETWTLTNHDIYNLVQRSFDLGKVYVEHAVINAGYEERKLQRIKENVDHEGHALNDLIQKILANTPEVRSIFPRPCEE